MTHDCQPACVAGWQPGRKCHCTQCGENFSIHKHFDVHRDNEKCSLPSEHNLVLNIHGVWVAPCEGDVYERFQQEKGTSS